MKYLILALFLTGCSSLTPAERAAADKIVIEAARDATSIGLHRLEKLDK